MTLFLYKKTLSKFQALFPAICLFFLSCTMNPTDTSRFQHNFQQGAADNLYNISELLGENPVLESEEKIFSPSSTKESSQLPISSLTTKVTSQFPPFSSIGGYPNAFLKKRLKSNLLKIQTVKRGQKATVSFAQDNIHIDPKISFINEYEFLDYRILNAKKTNWHKHIAQLLGKIRKFKGFPDTIYYILPLFVGNYLILYKVGSPDKIPYDELPLARRAGDMLAVPFVGYPIKYCVAEVIPDANERATGEYRPKCEGIRLQYAEYIQLNEEEKQVFRYENKPDLFPRDFFTLKESERKKYNWFSVRTIVRSPKKKIVGHQLFQPANLVEFHPAPRKLDVLDASGYDIKPEDKIRALFIPVEWVDYQIKRDSENLHSDFREEKKDTRNKHLRYFKIKFEELVENEIEYGGKKTLKNVFITDNYFSFNVEITEKNIGAYLVKFAFFKKPSKESENYIPKQWFEKDSALFFPSFSEKRRYYTSSLDHSHEDHDRFLRTTRFNPKAKEIKWYFSTQTPDDPENQWVRDMGGLALKLVNRALQIAGRDSDHKIKVTLDHREDKEVGDIRYNILNLIVSEGKADGGLLGLGPNVANPITGEVISATANVWISNILGKYIALVRRYVRFRVYPPAWTMQPFSKKVRTSLQEWIDKKNPECGDTYLKPLGVTPFLHEQIKNSCDEVTRFIEEQRTNKVTYDPENPDLKDKEIIKSCARKLAFLPILGTILHEILHGFAQRHIFSASIDRENFYKSYSEIKKLFGNLVSHEIKKLFGNSLSLKGTKCHPEPPQYSSVMDYMNLYNPILFVPGKLDIAALRFIYFDKVDLKEGGVLEVPAGADRNPDNPQKSILQAASDKRYLKGDLKNYQVLCGGEKIEDEDYKETNPNQPLCRKWDYGVNPLEISVNSILQTNSFLMNTRNRYDSKDISTYKNQYFTIQAGDLYKKWKQYRDELLNRNGTSIEDYFFTNPKHISQYKQIIETEKARRPDFKMYYDVREPIFDYFKRLAFMPAKHCIYKQESHPDSKPHYNTAAFENILAKEMGDYVLYPENSRERAVNCKSSVIRDWAEKNKKGKLIAEVGFLTNERKYFLRQKNRDPLDEKPAFKVLYEVLTDSNSATKYSSEQSKSPFFDIVAEPDFGAEYYRELKSYLLQGTDLNPYINETSKHGIGTIRLNRVLSYKIDEEILKDETIGIIAEKGILKSRLVILEDAIKRLKNKTAGKEWEWQFGWKSRHLIDIGRIAQSIENNNDYPFFTQVYDEYLSQKEKSWKDYLTDIIPDSILNNESDKDSFASFIKNHPATLHNRADSSFTMPMFLPNFVKEIEINRKDADGIFYNKDADSLIMVPYTGTDESFPAQLFRRFNEFAECIENHETPGMVCNDIEEKRVFVKAILTHYYTEALEAQMEDPPKNENEDID